MAIAAYPERCASGAAESGTTDLFGDLEPAHDDRPSGTEPRRIHRNTSGDSQFVTGDDNIVHLHRMRALSDAVVVGAGNGRDR